MLNVFNKKGTYISVFDTSLLLYSTYGPFVTSCDYYILHSKGNSPYSQGKGRRAENPNKCFVKGNMNMNDAIARKLLYGWGW